MTHPFTVIPAETARQSEHADKIEKMEDILSGAATDSQYTPDRHEDHEYDVAQLANDTQMIQHYSEKLDHLHDRVREIVRIHGQCTNKQVMDILKREDYQWTDEWIDMMEHHICAIVHSIYTVPDEWVHSIEDHMCTIIDYAAVARTHSEKKGHKSKRRNQSSVNKTNKRNNNTMSIYKSFLQMRDAF